MHAAVQTFGAKFLNFCPYIWARFSEISIWPCHLYLGVLCSHHHPDMNFYYIFLLLLVVLSVYSESPEPPDPLDLTVVAVCPNSSSDSLGVLAPVLFQNEMSGSALSCCMNTIIPATGPETAGHCPNGLPF